MLPKPNKDLIMSLLKRVLLLSVIAVALTMGAEPIASAIIIANATAFDVAMAGMVPATLVGIFYIVALVALWKHRKVIFVSLLIVLGLVAVMAAGMAI
jgi:hypothetical protein